jgi:hypothetical protein
MSDGMTVKPKEAYNILQGRAVFKEIISPKSDKYNAWLQLNFKELDAYGNYKVI